MHDLPAQAHTQELSCPEEAAALISSSGLPCKSKATGIRLVRGEWAAGKQYARRCGSLVVSLMRVHNLSKPLISLNLWRCVVGHWQNSISLSYYGDSAPTCNLVKPRFASRGFPGAWSNCWIRRLRDNGTTGQRDYRLNLRLVLLRFSQIYSEP